MILRRHDASSVGAAGVFRDVPLQCRCGHVRGIASQVSPVEGFRLVCYCKDCQAFARFLDRPDMLDAAGGTDIFQMPIGRVRVIAGADALRCVSFSARVIRWYADCCRTPIGNTAGPRFPVVGLIHSFMNSDIAGGSRSEMLGPPLCRIFDHSAIGPLPSDAAPPASLRIFVRRATRVFGWWVRGHGRPNPFFDDRTKSLRAAPRLLEPHERAALYR